MHAFLLISQNSNCKSQIEKLAGKLKAKVMEFPLVKIDDVRSLNNLIRLSFDKPTLIVCKDIHEAGEEALNAFLKNLEEPQENIYFVLTAPTIRKVLPTIVSRCQIIKVTNDKLNITNVDEMKQFFELSLGEKLSYVDKIKDRGNAIEFAENMVNFLHGRLHENDVKYDEQSKTIKEVVKTLSGLKGNGNVNLQLSNMVFQIENGKK
jgi:DNA polymerase III delta prime subunit